MFYLTFQPKYNFTDHKGLINTSNKINFVAMDNQERISNLPLQIKNLQINPKSNLVMILMFYLKRVFFH